MDDLIIAVMPKVVEIAVICLTFLATFLTVKINKWINQKINADQKQAIRVIVGETVKYVEKLDEKLQLKSEEKFDLAKEKAFEWINNEKTLKKIHISDVEIEILIEAFCQELFPKIEILK